MVCAVSLWVSNEMPKLSTVQVAKLLGVHQRSNAIYIDARWADKLLEQWVEEDAGHTSHPLFPGCELRAGVAGADDARQSFR